MSSTKKTEQLIREKKVSIKIVDFCLQSDIEGSIHYGACKEILKAIGDYDDNVCYGYAGLPSCANSVISRPSSKTVCALNATWYGINKGRKV